MPFFDIYHVQIMVGNIIANIQACLPLIGHFHTGGFRAATESTKRKSELRLVFRTIATVSRQSKDGEADSPFTGKVRNELNRFRRQVFPARPASSTSAAAPDKTNSRALPNDCARC